MGTNSWTSGGDGGATGPPGDELPAEVVEELRSDERSLAVVSVLSGADEPLPLIDLARAVIAREQDTAPEAVDRERACEVRTEIYERDLPKLTAAGAVSYDSLVSTASLTDAGAHLLDGG